MCTLLFCHRLLLSLLHGLDLLVAPLADYLRLGGDLEVEGHVALLAPLPHLPGGVVASARVRGLNLDIELNNRMSDK